MDWMKDMTERWVRIMGAANDGGTALDEAVHQISAIAGTPAKKRWFRSPARETRDAAETRAVTVLSRQLIAGVLVSDLMLDRLCAQAGQSREKLLKQLTFGMPRQLPDQQVRVLQAELSGSCAALRDPERLSHAGLGSRIEELLSLAEQQASAILEEARAEAARLTSSAGKQPCPRCGAS